VVGSRALVADLEAGLVVVNVADPAAPWVESVVPTPGQATEVIAVGELALVADGGGGLQVIDLAPDPPVIVVGHPTAAGAFNVTVVNRWAVVACGDGGVEIVEIFAPAVAAPTPASGARVRVAPNPFNPRTMVTYTMPEAGRVRVDLLDLAGRRLRTLADGHRPRGRHRVGLNAENLASGVYVLRLSGAGGGASIPITLVR